MIGFSSAVLAFVGDMLPPVVRLAVYPTWKLDLMIQGGYLTIGEGRIITEFYRRATEGVK